MIKIVANFVPYMFRDNFYKELMDQHCFYFTWILFSKKVTKYRVLT